MQNQVQYRPVRRRMAINAAVMMVTVFLLASALLVARGALFAADQADDDSYQRMLGGEVIFQTFDKDLSGGSGRVEALFYADSEAIWQVIGECRYEFIYLKGLIECEVLQPGENFMLLRHRIRNSWYTPTLDFTFSATRTPDGKGEAKLVSGNLKVLQASWEMRPVDADRAILVSHEVRIQPGFPAPRWLIRRSLNKDLPDMLACIRGLAHASGGLAQEQADLQRCPGDLDSLTK